MKLLGRTQDGEPIVQMSGAEYSSFCVLDKAMEGKVLDLFPEYRSDETVELSQAIENVRAYVTGLDIVNQMQEHLDRMKMALGNE